MNITILMLPIFFVLIVMIIAPFVFGRRFRITDIAMIVPLMMVFVVTMQILPEISSALNTTNSFDAINEVEETKPIIVAETIKPVEVVEQKEYYKFSEDNETETSLDTNWI